MKRILYLSQLLPYPPDAGPKVRSYYVLRYLAQQHRVTLLAFTRPEDSPEGVAHLGEFCEEVHTAIMRRSRSRDAGSLVASLLAGESFIIRRDFVPQMALLMKELLQTGRFDAVHADQLWMAQYALRTPSQAHGAKLVLDEHNACFQIFQRLASGERNPAKRLFLEREWRVLKRYEARACAQFNHLVTVTEEDRNTLQNLVEAKANKRKGNNPYSPIPLSPAPLFHSIPICVDTQTVQPVSPAPGTKDVLHLGTMFFLPNVEGVLWFAREVWPRVVAQVPEATFTIAGKNPPAVIQKLSVKLNERSAISDQRSVIDVTGYVPDPQPYLERAGVFIVPLLSGGGMRVKIVDAWRWGLPVVSTAIGADGLSYRDGENILIADGFEAFARAVVSVLCEPRLAQRLRENGRRWVERHYDWRTVYPAWDSIYNSNFQP